MSSEVTKAERIAVARANLAAAYAANPDRVERFNARMSKLAAARKRERERVDHLVLGKKRPDPDLTRPEGMSKGEWKIERKRLRDAGGQLSDPDIDAQLALHERWSHKQYGTPETWEQDSKHTDCLHQMEANGSLTTEQVEWAAEISNVHRSIESEVAVKVASLEARVDQSGRPHDAVAEGVNRVRMHLAYGYWRDSLPAPKSLVLDMIVGDRVGYTVAAKRYRVGDRKAKARLIAAIDSWPDFVDRAHRYWSRAEIEASNAIIGLHEQTEE